MERLCLIPVIPAIIYAIYTQWRNGNRLNMLLLLIGGMVSLFNALFVYELFVSDSGITYSNVAQQILSCFIVPVAYAYFAGQMGRSWKNPTSMILCALVLLLAVPSGYYVLDGTVPRIDDTSVSPMLLHFYSGGSEVRCIRMADIIVLAQAFVTLSRMLHLAKVFLRYRIALSHSVRYFLVWWLVAVVFIVFVSLLTLDEFVQPANIWTYYATYSLLCVSMYVLLAFNFDLHPVMLKLSEAEAADDKGVVVEDADDIGDCMEAASGVGDGVVSVGDADDAVESVGDVEQGNVAVEDVDAFLVQSRYVADRVRKMLDDKSRCLDVNLTTESAVQELGTNRTYFYRIVKAEFGCSFNDLLLQQRMKYAAEMIVSTNLSIQDVSMRCGFADNNTFARRFRQTYGMPPSKYRMEHKMED